MSNRDKLQGQMEVLKNSLNEYARSTGIDDIVKNFDASKMHKHKTTGNIECGFKTLVSTVEDVVKGIKESIEPENNDISAARRIPPANTTSAIWHTMSCTSMVDSLSPFSFSESIPSSLTKHSRKGCGPGALPPEVIKLAPFGRISE